MSPTARTLTFLRRSGYAADVVERWIPRVNRRRDLFGCIDVVAVRRGVPGVLAVQCTSLANVSARLQKARRRPELAVWLRAGNGFEVWGWYERGGRWRVKRVTVGAEDLRAVVLEAPRRRSRKEGHQRLLFAPAAADSGGLKP